MDTPDLLSWATELLEAQEHVRATGFCGVKAYPAGNRGQVWLECGRQGHWIVVGGPESHQIHFYKSRKAAQACWDYISA